MYFMKQIIMLLALTIAVFSSCKDEPKDNLQQQSLSTLFAMMQGSFNSETQAKADSTYYNISLHMYPIWKDKGNWLYVEQALNSSQDKPYRQRVYEVKIYNDSLFTSNIYTIPNDSLWIGKWKTPEDFSALNPKDLSLREGCSVLLKQVAEGQFKGETGEKSCASSLRGAAFATSEVEMCKGKIVSWDRGFDLEGNHIWGAEKGGYVFEKTTD